MTRTVRTIAVMALLAGPATAVAQAPTPDDQPTQLRRAQALVNEASAAFRSKDYLAALKALRAAEPLAEKADDPALPQIRFNIARCLEQLGRPAEAMAAYDRYNELPDASHRKQRAFEAMRQLRGQVFGTLSVACSPTGSLVEIAGITKGAASCPWQSQEVKPGAYAVKISHPGYESKIETIDIEAGKSFKVEATLKSLAPPPSLVVDAGPPPNLWPWMTMGAGLVVAASGGYFTLTAASDRDDAQQLPPGDDRQALVDDFETNRTLSYVMYGTGAAIVVGGIVWWLLDEDEDKDEDPLTASVRASPAGLQVRF